MYLKFVRKVGLQCSHHRKKERIGRSEEGRKEGREGRKRERERKKGREKRECDTIGMFIISLTMVIISQCITYVMRMKTSSCTKQFLFVTYTSIKLEKAMLLLSKTLHPPLRVDSHVLWCESCPSDHSENYWPGITCSFFLYSVKHHTPVFPMGL